METGKFVANINYYTIGQKENRAPYVIVEFAYQNIEGKDKTIRYIGSLSDAAIEYTLKQLKSIGYKGNLQSFNELKDFCGGDAGLETEGITINIVDDEYQGKSRIKVNYFYKGRQELNEEETHALVQRAFEYRNKKTSKPKAAPKKKNAPTQQQEAEAEKGIDDLFNAEEPLHGSGDKVPF